MIRFEKDYECSMYAVLCLMIGVLDPESMKYRNIMIRQLKILYLTTSYLAGQIILRGIQVK